MSLTLLYDLRDATTAMSELLALGESDLRRFRTRTMDRRIKELEKHANAAAVLPELVAHLCRRCELETRNIEGVADEWERFVRSDKYTPPAAARAAADAIRRDASKRIEEVMEGEYSSYDAYTSSSEDESESSE